MNQSTRKCHEIEGCPNLYVDAFKMYRDQTHDSQCAFILTHYHSDHYNGLPRDGAYVGPALIHCTPITAELLRTVHGVHDRFVMEHEYGSTWTFPLGKKDGEEEDAAPGDMMMHKKNKVGSKRRREEEEKLSSAAVAQVTFYDANHCPGAAIVLVQLPGGDKNTDDGGRCVIHTGDMRYHEKMKEYPLIRRAVENNKIDVVYLDTTYGNPKYEFVPQDVAVQSIAQQVEELLGTNTKGFSCSLSSRSSEPSSTLCGGEQSPTSDMAKSLDSSNNNNARNDNNTFANEEAFGESNSTLSSSSSSAPSTLVLLSCYSIGKEKVLWETSKRTNNYIYVTEKKYRMLQCIQKKHKSTGPSCCRVIERCTRDPSTTDLHVVPMRMAGEMWPFFRPNYNACVEYAQQLPKAHDRIVAFVPTGWAEGSNWNKKNAISKRRVSYQRDDIGILTENTIATTTTTATTHKKSSFVDVEIRLISYSEHSTFSELCSFVEYVKPRKVIPTVFGNESEYRVIERRFNNLIDTKRAKQYFLNSMTTTTTITTTTTRTKTACLEASSVTELIGCSDDEQTKMKKVCDEEGSSDDDNDDDDVTICSSSKGGNHELVCNKHDDKVAKLVSMGFDITSCWTILNENGGNLERTIEILLTRRNINNDDDMSDSTCFNEVRTAASPPTSKSCKRGMPTQYHPHDE